MSTEKHTDETVSGVRDGSDDFITGLEADCKRMEQIERHRSRSRPSIAKRIARTPTAGQAVVESTSDNPVPAHEGSTPTPLALVDPDGSWVTVEVTVESLFEPASDSQQQIGIIEDETGKAKMVVWRDAEQDIVLNEGDVIRIQNAKPGFHEKLLTLTTVVGTDIFVFKKGDGSAPVNWS